MMWLKKQLWAWVLFGIFVMAVFFWIAKGLIVFIGGTALGVYLYSIYGKDNSSGDNNGKGNNINVNGVNDKIFNNTMSYVKTGVSTINNVLNPQKNGGNKQVKEIEGFETNRLFSNIWWGNSR